MEAQVDDKLDQEEEEAEAQAEALPQEEELVPPAPGQEEQLETEQVNDQPDPQKPIEDPSSPIAQTDGIALNETEQGPEPTETAAENSQQPEDPLPKNIWLRQQAIAARRN